MRLKFWKKEHLNLNFSENIKREIPHRFRHQLRDQKGYEVILAVITFVFGAVSWAATAATVITIALYAAVIGYSIYNVWSSSQQAKKSKGGGAGRDLMNSGHLLNTRSSAEPVAIPYGDCRVGGNIVYVNATGTSNEYLHIVLTLGEGPVDSIYEKTYELMTLDVAPGGTGWSVNDTITGATSGETCVIVQVLTTLTYTIRDRSGAFTLGEILSNGTNTADQGAANPVISASSVDGAQIWLDDKLIASYGTDATYEFFTGTSSQTVCATLQGYDPNWDDAMRYTAYIYVRLHYNEEVFSSMPQITVRLKGRLLYDTRNGSTTYSNNDALVAYDFLRNDRYSIGFPSDVFDNDSINDAANWCDTNTYTFNGAVMNYQSFLDNLDDILKNFRAGIIWSEGEYKLIVYEYDTPVMTIAENEIVADSFKISVPGIPETPNRCVINYVDAVDNYLSKQRIIADENAVLLYDNQERDFTLDLIGTTTAENVEKLGAYFVERNRLNYQFSFSCAAKALALEPLDMVTITHYLPGWDEEIVRVINVVYNQGDYVTLTVLAEDPDLYDDDVDIETHNAYSTNLPTPSNFPPVPVSIENVPGLAADPQTALGHAANHENSGSDEISVTGLSGLLADPQTAYMIQLLASDPVSPVEGQIWYNTTDHHYRGYDGSAVVDLDYEP